MNNTNSEILLETFDYFDDVILETILTDTVEKVCIESKENMEAIGAYLELMETDYEESLKYNDSFISAITETFANEMTRYIPMVITETSRVTREYGYYMSPNRNAKLAPAPEPGKSSGLRQEPDKSPKLRLMDRIKNWKGWKTPGNIYKAIKSGFNRAKDYVKEKSQIIGNRALSGIIRSAATGKKFIPKHIRNTEIVRARNKRAQAKSKK